MKRRVGMEPWLRSTDKRPYFTGYGRRSAKYHTVVGALLLLSTIAVFNYIITEQLLWGPYKFRLSIQDIRYVTIWWKAVRVRYQRFTGFHQTILRLVWSTIKSWSSFCFVGGVAFFSHCSIVGGKAHRAGAKFHMPCLLSAAHLASGTSVNYGLSLVTTLPY